VKIYLLLSQLSPAGPFLNGVRFNLAELRYGSVLGRIGLAWMFAALIFMNTRLKGRIVWFWSLLIGYWLLLLIFPAPDGGEGSLNICYSSAPLLCFRVA